jgi:hypothetical protein
LLATLSTVHLSGWNFMHHSFSQCPSLSRSFCRVSASLLLFYYTEQLCNSKF